MISWNWVTGSHLDSAFTGSITVSDHINVSLISPLRTPWILDFVVFYALKLTVTDSQDCMIQIGLAFSVEHTTFIHLETQRVSLNSNRNRVESDCFQKGRLFICCDTDICTDSSYFIFWLVFARLVHFSIRIFCFGSDTVISDILKRKIHKTSIAAIVTISTRAID